MLIMVVDDEKDMAELFKQRFRKEINEKEIEFVFYTSAENVLNDLKNNNHPNVVLILSDINMPGMNGLELLRVIKKDFAKIKVAMVTAYGGDDNHRQAIEYGADAFINKPIDFTVLKNTCLKLAREA